MRLESSMSIVDELRRGIKQSGKSLYRIAADAGIELSGLCRFMSGERPSVNIHTAEALARAIGMELIIRPTGRGKRAKHGKA